MVQQGLSTVIVLVTCYKQKHYHVTLMLYNSIAVVVVCTEDEL